MKVLLWVAQIVGVLVLAGIAVGIVVRFVQTLATTRPPAGRAWRVGRRSRPGLPTDGRAS